MLRSLAIALVAGLPLLAGCAEDDATPLTPAIGGDLFARYVALGNSITAGFQSGGINDSLQLRSYPFLLAERAGQERFSAPLLARPGCPAPFAAPLRPRISETRSCVLINVPRIVNNAAVPGENIGDLLRVPTSGDLAGLHALMLGQRTQLQVMAQADPTLVSLWIGNNDALRAALQGRTDLLTPAGLFAGRVDTVANAIAAAEPRDAIFIGVVDPRIAPLLQPGAFYYLAWAGAVSQGRPSPFGRPVSADCAPGTPGERNQVSLAILGTSPDDVPVISCAADAPLVLGTAEAAVVAERVAAYNAALEAAAQQRGWLFLDPNTVFGPALADPSQVRKCQGLPTASTPAEIGQAIATTCPNLQDPGVGFGALISLDGVHPSTAAHVLIADALAAALNARHGLNLPTS